MARVINKTFNVDFFANVRTTKADGSTLVRTFKVGDVVENLRYIENEELKTISGRVTNIICKDVSKTLVSSNPVDTFSKDVIITRIVIDASKEYESSIINVNAREIVEDEGVTDVVHVDVYPTIAMSLTNTYTDGTSDTDEFTIGQTLRNDIIMNTIRGNGDITGNFVLVTISYIMKNSVLSVKSLILKDELTGKVISVTIDRIISIGEVGETIDWSKPVEVTTDNIADIMAYAVPVAILAPAGDMVLSEAITVPAGKDIVLDLSGGNITSTGTAITNNGKLKITGGKVTGLIAVDNTEGSTLIIEDTEIEGTSQNQTGGAAIANFGDMIVKSGTFVTNYEGSASDAGGNALIRNKTTGNLTIESGSFTSKSLRTYAIISEGNVEIEDVVIDGAHGALAIDAGTGKVTGGSFRSTEYYALYLSNDTAQASFIVEDGTFEGKTISVLVGSDENTGVDSAVQIKGGVFKNTLKNQANVNPGFGIKVSGGEFYEAFPEAYLEDGFVLNQNAETGHYEVIPAPVPNDGE